MLREYRLCSTDSQESGRSERKTIFESFAKCTWKRQRYAGSLLVEPSQWSCRTNICWQVMPISFAAPRMSRFFIHCSCSVERRHPARIQEIRTHWIPSEMVFAVCSSYPLRAASLFNNARNQIFTIFLSCRASTEWLSFLSASVARFSVFQFQFWENVLFHAMRWAHRPRV